MRVRQFDAVGYSRKSLRPRTCLLEPLEDRFLLAATKIMPLGDSITEAFTAHAGYRYWLWNTLQAAGFSEIDFVGSRTGVANGSPLYPNFDQNHEGHVGWRADEILAQIGGWANTYRPDVVLMHLGTNDLAQNQSVSSTITELGSIIDTIRISNPNVTVLLAQIIPDNLTPTTIQQFNSQIPTLASQKNTAQSRVITVDQWTGFSVSADTYDGVHPDFSGEQKMSNKWYSTLRTILPAPSSNPTFLSDLNPTFNSNGFGPYERDMSNAELPAADGRPITLNGVVYPKGLGVHAVSELRYNLGGQYSTFTSDIGLDDEWQPNGSVVFQVWTDGTKIYDSGLMLNSTATKSINLNVTGKNELKLIVTDGGDTNFYDHADWANAKITKPASGGGVTVNAGSGGTINEGSNFSSSGSFADSGSGPWTATVNYGDGTGTVPLTLNANKTFSLSHVYGDNGSYIVTVTVNGTTSGSGTAGVTVNNVIPTVNAGADGSATAGTAFSSSGSFTDPGADTWTATVNWGDGSATVPLALNANKTFNLSKVYTQNGTYTITVTVLDDDGGSSSDTALVTVTGGTIPISSFLSDLNPTFASNGYGPYERDTSNGELPGGDGRPITLNGVVYPKGLGVHAVSELRYNLGGQYSTFTSDIGLDDEWQPNGSVVFQVWTDGSKLYDSGLMLNSTATKSINLNVTGKNELKLIVTDGGDTNFYDHADWANAKITKPASGGGVTVNAGSGGTINEGSNFSSSGSFADSGSGPWTATVNYGDGTGTVPLTLNSNKTFSLSHVYGDNGGYTVTVIVNNPTTSGTGTAGVTVNNVIPSVNAGPDGSATAGTAFSSSGSFTDPGADTWTATVNWGDGSATVPLALNANKTFNLSKVYTQNGTYTITVTVLDDDGGSSSDTALVTVTGGTIPTSSFLSDLNPTFASNGYGPYERDRSNGGLAAGDGHTIKLNGVSYTKGLGVHAASDLRFNLAGQYSSFTADIGVDDEVGNQGTIVFQVWGDGVKLYDSGLMKGNTATKSINVNISGRNELKLIVTDSGNGNAYDHADWANARILAGTGATSAQQNDDAVLQSMRSNQIWDDSTDRLLAELDEFLGNPPDVIS